jgi:hypothetical protein
LALPVVAALPQITAPLVPNILSNPSAGLELPMALCQRPAREIALLIKAVS